VQSAALEVVMAMEDNEKVRQEIQSLKLALISADPVYYIPQFYPEIAPPPLMSSNVDEIADTIDDEETPIIDFQLTPPSGDEAADIISRLLNNKTVTVEP
jgi:hypothetical protein